MAESPANVRAVGLRISSVKLVLTCALAVVGEGTSSDNRCGGSLRDSVFQMPVPQGNEEPAEGFQAAEPTPGLVFAAQLEGSAAGLAGLEPPPVDEGPPMVSDDFRGRASGTSFNHEVRRVGLGAGAAAGA